MQYIEFPVTIPNQRKVEQIINYASYLNILVSLTVGIASGSLLYLSYAFAAQLVALLLIVAPNFLFKSERPIGWLSVKY